MPSRIRSKRESMKELGQLICPITIYATGIFARIPSFYLASTYSGAPPLLVVGYSRVLSLLHLIDLKISCYSSKWDMLY